MVFDGKRFYKFTFEDFLAANDSRNEISKSFKGVLCVFFLKLSHQYYFRTISYPSERLPHLLTLQRIGLISAEDEDLLWKKNIIPLLLIAKSSLLMEEEYLSSLHYMKDYIGVYKMRDFLR